MSSMVIFNRVKSFFPEGLLLDTSGNCFNLFMEFPTKDGKTAGVLIFEEGVNYYNNNGEYLSKEEYFNLHEQLFTDDEDMSFTEHVENLFSSYDTEFDDNDKQFLPAIDSEVFDTNTMIEIGKTWSKFNICFDKALRGE